MRVRHLGILFTVFLVLAGCGHPSGNHTVGKSRHPMAVHKAPAGAKAPLHSPPAIVAIQELPFSHRAIDSVTVSGAGAFIVLASPHHLALYRSGQTHPLAQWYPSSPISTPSINTHGEVAATDANGDGNIRVFTPAGTVIHWRVPASEFLSITPAPGEKWLVSSDHEVRLYSAHGQPLIRFSPNFALSALALSNGVVTWDPHTATAYRFAWNGTLQSKDFFSQLLSLNQGLTGTSVGVGGLMSIPIAPGYAIDSGGGTLIPDRTGHTAARILGGKSGGFAFAAGNLGYYSQNNEWILTTWQGKSVRIPWNHPSVPPESPEPMATNASGTVIVISRHPGPEADVVDVSGRILARLRLYTASAFISPDNRWAYITTYNSHLCQLGPLPLG